MTAYIFQIILFQLLFLLGYEILFRRETFFTWNRWYLLITAVVSLFLPLIKIEALSFLLTPDSISEISNVWISNVIVGEPETIGSISAGEVANPGAEINWWFIIYSLGFCGSIYLLKKKYNELKRLFRFRTIASEGGWKIIEVPDSNIACTFFNTIFLGDKLAENERQQILSHELVHVKQKHSLDLIFFEILKVIFWFNPLIYIYQNRIATLHEYIADAVVVKNIKKRRYYEQLLNSAFSTSNISFINQFFSQSLTRLTVFGRSITFGKSGGEVKKRIVMLQKRKSRTIAKLKYLALAPLMLVMLTYVACSDGENKAKTEDSLAKYTYTMQLDEPIMDAKTKEIHISYESFLRNNPEYVSWTQMNRENGEIRYSVHHKDEKVPGDYSTHNITSPDGSFYTAYFIPPLGSESGSKKEPVALDEVGVGFAEGVEDVPMHKNCENAVTKEEKQACMSNMIKQHVQGRFNTGLGKQLELKGYNRILAIFTIDKQGKISNLRVRTPHPELEEEAKRVINSLPQMTPAKQNGEEVEVSYTLPITLMVNG